MSFGIEFVKENWFKNRILSEAQVDVEEFVKTVMIPSISKVILGQKILYNCRYEEHMKNRTVESIEDFADSANIDYSTNLNLLEERREELKIRDNEVNHEDSKKIEVDEVQHQEQNLETEENVLASTAVNSKIPWTESIIGYFVTGHCMNDTKFLVSILCLFVIILLQFYSIVTVFVILINFIFLFIICQKLKNLETILANLDRLKKK